MNNTEVILDEFRDPTIFISNVLSMYYEPLLIVGCPLLK